MYLELGLELGVLGGRGLWASLTDSPRRAAIIQPLQLLRTTQMVAFPPKLHFLCNRFYRQCFIHRVSQLKANTQYCATELNKYFAWLAKM